MYIRRTTIFIIYGPAADISIVVSEWYIRCLIQLRNNTVNERNRPTYTYPISITIMNNIAYALILFC